MRVSLLGRLAVTRTDGRYVELRPGQPAALLALLALRPAQPVAVEEAVHAALWDGKPPPSARNAIQVHVAHLRRRIGAEGIGSGGAGYWVNADPLDIDVLRLERQLADASRSLAQGDVKEAQRLAEAWDDLLTAEPLPGLQSTAAFVPTVVHRLREVQRSARTLRLRLGMAADPASAVNEARALAHDHPLDEAIQALWVSALHAVGRRAEALAAWARARSRLVAVLGLEPGGELREVQRRILEERDEGPPAPVSWAVPADKNVLVGRESELTALTQAWVAGTRLLTVHGFPGVGKTSLALRHAQGSQVPVIWVRCDPDGATTALTSFLRTTGLPDDNLPKWRHSLPWLVGGPSMLVVLDDVPPRDRTLAHLVDGLLTVPGARVLVTSWEPTWHAAEQPLRLTGLRVATQPTGAPPALQLLLGRLREIGVDTDRGGYSQEELLTLVTTLEGIPLTIRLAAHRLLEVPAAELLAELSRGAAALREESDDLPARHRTARSSVQGVLRSLSPEATAMLSAIAAYPAGAPADALDDIDQADVLIGLRSRALVSTSIDPLTGSRAHVPYLVRTAVGTDPDHLIGWVKRLVGRPAVAGAFWPPHGAELRRFQAETDNLAAAIESALDSGRESDALHMVVGTQLVWQGQGRTAEALDWLRRIQLAKLDPDDEMDAELMRAWLLHGLARTAEAESARDVLLAMAERTDDPHRRAMAAAAAAWSETDGEPGWLVDQMRTLEPQLTDMSVRLVALTVLAVADPDPVTALANVVAVCEQNGRDLAAETALINASVVSILAGGDPRAVTWAKQALERARQSTNWLTVALAQVRLGAALVQTDRATEARAPLLAALRSLAALGAAAPAAGAVCTLAAAEGALGHEALASALLARWRLRLEADGREPWLEEQVLVDAYLCDLPAAADQHQLSNLDARVLRQVDDLLAVLDEQTERAEPEPGKPRPRLDAST